MGRPFPKVHYDQVVPRQQLLNELKTCTRTRGGSKPPYRIDSAKVDLKAVLSLEYIKI